MYKNKYDNIFYTSSSFCGATESGCPSVESDYHCNMNNNNILDDDDNYKGSLPL